MAGAVAAVTSRIKVGTWVLSALHRNAGITAKAVETLDEISGGRFVLGLGAGHAGRARRMRSGCPRTRVRPLRGGAPGHRPAPARRPRRRRGDVAHREGPGSSRGARDRVGSRSCSASSVRAASAGARYADIWSCYAEEKSDMTELGPRLAMLEAACAEVGATRPRSAGRPASG